MKHVLITLGFACSAFGQVELPSNHVDLSTSIIEFLSRTEHCLNTCQDAASVNAAIPQLKQLKDECDRLVEKQKSLPEPTVQDFMAVQHQMDAFYTVWNAIRKHIERMEQNKLLTEEIRAILCIEPSNPQK